MRNSSNLKGVGILDESPEKQKSDNVAIIDCDEVEPEEKKRVKKRHERTVTRNKNGCQHGCR